MGRKTIATCDCGCGKEVGPGGFQLSHVGMNMLFRGLHISGDLTFVDLDHLSKWLDSALPIARKLKEEIKNLPEKHGIIENPAFKTLYFD